MFFYKEDVLRAQDENTPLVQEEDFLLVQEEGLLTAHADYSLCVLDYSVLFAHDGKDMSHNKDI